MISPEIARKTTGVVFPSTVIAACLLAAVTLLRWLSWRPYSPFMLPYDAFVLGSTVAIAMLILERIRAACRIAVGAEAVGVAALGTVVLWWVGGVLVGTGRAFALISIALVVLSGAALVISACRHRRGRVPNSLFCAVLAASLVVSIAPENLWFGLGAPLVLATCSAAGVSALPSRRVDFGVLVAAGAVVIFCVTVPAERLEIRATAAASGSPSLVLIVLDTLRRDHMSLYGYSRPTTPHLDKWSSDALVMESMTSTASWTLPAHASMFTGLHPRAHGAHGYRSEKREYSTYALSAGQRTLAEVARDAGIATGAVVANHHYLGPRLGVDQGFQDYLVVRPKRGYQLPWSDALAKGVDSARYDLHDWAYYRARFVTDIAIDWVRTQRDNPYFLFVNYLDVHRPSGRPASGAIPWEDEQQIPRYYPELTKVLEREPLPTRVRRSLVNAYDRELMALDAELARLLSYIESSERGASTYVIVTSDHGEFFGEHDLIDHMMHLYNEVTAVPLIIKGPGIGGERSTAPAQLTDVFATALDALQLPLDDVPSTTDSRSLLRSGIDDSRSIVSEWYSSANGRLRDPRFNDRFERDIVAIQRGPLRLLEYEGGSVELYDIEQDPRETHDISTERTEDALQLLEELAAWRTRTRPTVGPILGDLQVSPEMQEQLRELGYAE